MFTSLIVIFILLAIGLAALLVALTGRATDQAPALSTSKRAALIGVGLVAWLGAFYMYIKPQSGDEGTATALSWGDARRSETPVSLRESPTLNRESGADNTTLSPSAAAMEASADRRIEPALPEKLVQIGSDGDVIAEPAEAEVVRTPPKPASTTAVLVPVPQQTSLPQLTGTPTITRPVVAAAPRNYAPRPAKPRAPRPSQPVAPGKGTTIHILNSLGEDETQERLTLAIEGRPLANFEVNTAKPNVHVPLVLPRPGKLHYTLTGTSLRDGYVRLAGKGCIEMTHQSSYEVRRTEDGSQLYLARVATRHY